MAVPGWTWSAATNQIWNVVNWRLGASYALPKVGGIDHKVVALNSS